MPSALLTEMMNSEISLNKCCGYTLDQRISEITYKHRVHKSLPSFIYKQNIVLYILCKLAAGNSHILRDLIMLAVGDTLENKMIL